MLRKSLWTLVLVVALAFGATPASAGRVELVSKVGTPGPAHAVGKAGLGFDASGDGSFAVFDSTSPNMVPGQSDGNDGPDVFLWDRTTGEVRLVSHTSGSATATPNAESSAAQISADGRWIAFCSAGHGLIPNQERLEWRSQLYLYDRVTDTTTLVSRSIGSPVRGANQDSCLVGLDLDLSADGRYLAFTSAASDLVSPQDGGVDSHIYLYDRVTGTLALVSHGAGNSAQRGNRSSEHPSISADGRWVTYASTATNLVAGVLDNRLYSDVFLFDRTTGENVLVSHANGSPSTPPDDDDDSESPKISADGAWIAYSSFVRTLVAGQSDPMQSNDVFLWERSTGTTRLVSHASGSTTTAGNDDSSSSSLSISADGAWIAYESTATDLASGATDSHSFPDVFLFDRSTDTNTLVSRAAGSSAAANDWSQYPLLTPDGSRVFFTSRATDLVTGVTDTNQGSDLFAWNRSDGGISLVNHVHGDATVAGGLAGLGAVLADDGLSLLFLSAASNLTSATDTNGGSDLFLHDLTTGGTTAVSFSPAVVSASAAGESSLVSKGSNSVASSDGRFIVFLSQASDLVPGQVDTNQQVPGSLGRDVFLYDRQTRSTTLVSHSAASPVTTGNDGSQEAAISRDGRYIAYVSEAADLVPGQIDQNNTPDVFVFDRTTGTTLLASGSSPTQTTSGNDVRISGDGRYVAYRSPSIHIFDRETGAHTSVSAPAGQLDTFQLSDEGRYLAFISSGTNVVSGQSDTNGGMDVFLYDRVTGSTILVSRSAASSTTTGNGPATGRPEISADGRFVSFASQATNHVSGQVDTNGFPDVFLFDQDSGAVTLVSRSAASPGTTGNGFCPEGRVSKNGRFVLLTSAASDLVPGQQDSPSASFDLFLFDRLTESTSLVSHRAGSLVATGNERGRGFAISADGNRIAFWSGSTDLIDGLDDTNLTDDLFLYDRLSGSLELVTRTSSSPGTAANAITIDPWISDDGLVVLFDSSASNLVAGDFNINRDVFAFVPEDLDFYSLTPCRLFDTRRPEDGPALNSALATVMQLNGACGIPATARALAVNVTAIEAPSSGYLTLYPGDGLPPVASTLNFQAGLTRANNALVRLAPSGNGTMAIRPMINGGGTVHVVIDVVGFFE